MKLLVFDMGHVFVDFEWETVCAGFHKRASCTPEALRSAFKELSQLGYESGRIGTDGFLSEMNRLLGMSIDRSEFEQLWTATFRENEQMAALLQTLRKQKPIYLLSNTNEVHYEWLQTQFDVARHFDQLILSYKVGSSKPEAAIYLEVLKLSGFEAQDCLFVDDLECNINAARDLGMNTIHFQGVEPLKASLKAQGFAV